MRANMRDAEPTRSSTVIRRVAEVLNPSKLVTGKRAISWAEIVSR
jgi:hypothetical protein